MPFGVLADALDDYVHGLDPQRLEVLTAAVRTELAHVFPSLTPSAADPETALPNERYRSHRVVRELLELLGRTQPLVLLLDDVHWADPASVELVSALLHRPPAAPVLLALALRPHAAPERLSIALARAERSGTLTRATLNALTRDEARELLGDSANGAGAELYEESGGNPFYLEQLARSLERSVRTLSTGPAISLAGTPVPGSVAAALAEELAVLSTRARAVLEGASVAGDAFEPELAAAAADVPYASALEAMNELLRLDLVRSTDVPMRFRFRHPLLRRAVYEATAGGWRISAHQRSAEALAAHGASASARAHHIEYSARHGDLGAVAVLREAGESAAKRAPASAERWFGAALRVLPAAAPAGERVELLLARSGSLAATGHFADSHDALLESLQIVPPESETLRVRLTTACAGVENLLGQHEQAHGRLETALAGIEDPRSSAAVALMVELAVDGLFSGDYDAMHDWAARAADAAKPLADRALIAATLAIRAAGAALSGAIDEAQAHREQAAKLVDTLTDDELARRLDTLFHLATAEVNLDHFEDVCQHTERALRIGRATGQGDLFPIILPMLGTSLWLQGRVAESVDVLDGAVEAARLLDNPHGLVWNLLNRSLAGFAAGDIDLALTIGEEAVEVARELDASSASSWAAVAFATSLLASGQPDRAAEVLVTAGGVELRPIGGGWRARCLELLTRCHLASGKHREAIQAASSAVSCAKAIKLPMAAAMANLAEAALMLDAREPNDAAERALGAAATLEGVGNLFDAATARTLAGRALAQAGSRDEAAAQLERSAAGIRHLRIASSASRS